MPVDFNPYFLNYTMPNQFKTPFSQQAGFKLKSLDNDTFESGIMVQTSDIATDFDGMKIEQKDFGKTQNGENITLFTITNKNGASVDLSDFGATIVSVKVPDKAGNIVDVVQGYDNVTPYETAPVGHAGGTIGPCANKINGGTFKIGEDEYKLEFNKDGGKTHCHGGKEGFDLKKWQAEIIKDGIKFTYTKPDGEGGYPANVTASVTYKFDNNNALHVVYEAETDKDTIINLTNHSYFNLDGAENSGENSVAEHVAQLPNSTKYTPVNELAIPTGELADVEGTKYDFRAEKTLTENFDMNFVVDGYDGIKMIDVAHVKSPKTGIQLSVSTNLPGFQFYTAENLGKEEQPVGKDGKKYEKRSSFCVEPQFFPDAINSFDEKPILKSGEKFNREIVYSFGLFQQEK